MIDKRFTYIVIILYLILGFLFMINDLIFPQWYIAIIMFFGFKILFNYRKCTISYIECKLRGVKRKYGYLNSFMDAIVDLRYNIKIFVLLQLTFIVLMYYHFIIKKVKMVI